MQQVLQFPIDTNSRPSLVLVSESEDGWECSLEDLEKNSLLYELEDLRNHQNKPLSLLKDEDSAPAARLSNNEQQGLRRRLAQVLRRFFRKQNRPHGKVIDKDECYSMTGATCTSDASYCSSSSCWSASTCHVDKRTSTSTHYITQDDKVAILNMIRIVVAYSEKIKDSDHANDPPLVELELIIRPREEQQKHQPYEPLIQTRLLEHSDIIKSTHDFEFIVDRVSKEVKHLYDNNEIEETDVTHVKTGVWQVTNLDANGSPQTPFYIVTGVSMSDRVDTKKLRRAILADAPLAQSKNKHVRHPKLCMAPQRIAEELVGFPSGTMTPICHSVDMKLYLEESIVDNMEDPARHKLLVGSGMMGTCLSISADKFLAVAKSNSKGLSVCSLVQKNK